MLQHVRGNNHVETLILKHIKVMSAADSVRLEGLVDIERCYFKASSLEYVRIQSLAWADYQDFLYVAAALYIFVLIICVDEIAQM